MFSIPRQEGVHQPSYGELDCLAEPEKKTAPAPVAIVSAVGPNFHIPMVILTRPRQEFTCVHRIGLTLACDFCGEKLLGVCLWLSTPPLPATHPEVGTGIGHLPGAALTPLTHSERLRVALHNGMDGMTLILG